MLLNTGLFREGYNEIKSDSRKNPVEIFVAAADCDSCCAFRTLKDLLESDNITYSVTAVSDWDYLKLRVNQLPRDEKERAIVLINCGGARNLEEELGLGETPLTRTFVFDSHRPLNLRNVQQSNKSVFVFQNEKELTPGGDEEIPVVGDDEASSSGSSDDSEGEDEDGLEEEHAARRQRVGEAGESSALRRRERVRRRKEAGVLKARYYMRGMYYGRPAGCLMLDVACTMSKESLDHHAPLWYAIVSVTDQFVHQRMSIDAYNAIVLELAGHVTGLPQMEVPPTVMLEDGLVVKNFDNRRIVYQESEFRFMLMRHWSLYESMMHSPYVSSALRTWTDQGRAALKGLLAEMGLPLDACQDKHSHMSPLLQRQLEERLKTFAEKYGMGDYTFSSFTRSHGFKHHVSASDVVFAATALIESGVTDDEHSWQESFWRAVNALHESHHGELLEGFAAAKLMQRAIMQQGGQVLLNSGFGGEGKRAGARGGYLRKNSRFVTVDLNEGGGANASVFQQPMALLRLAIFLREVVKSKQHKPLVTVSPQDQNGNCTVVGVVGAPKLTDTKGNQFNIFFSRACEETSAKLIHDSFHGCICKVRYENLPEFLEGLKSAMDFLGKMEIEIGATQ